MKIIYAYCTFRQRQFQCQTIHFGCKKVDCKKYAQLLYKLKDLKEEIAGVRAELLEDTMRIASLEQEMEESKAQIQNNETQLVNLTKENKDIALMFESYFEQTLLIDTMAGTYTGKVVSVVEDAVELEEIAGNMLILPFAKITSFSTL